jgi:hypothetical protein
MDIQKLERLAAPATSRTTRFARGRLHAKRIRLLTGPTRANRTRSTGRAAALRLAGATIGAAVKRGKGSG